MNALLQAYEQVDLKAAVRQNQTTPPGAVYAPATRAELATAIVEISTRAHARSCVDDQLRLEVDREYLPPLVGDRAHNQVVLCGGPSEAERATWVDARRRAAAAFNQPNQALHDDHSQASMSAQVVSLVSTPKGVTLLVREVSEHARCVRNGRYGRAGDGSWGPLCDWQDLPSSASADVKTFHLAPQTLPFALKPGDRVLLDYELDPDAPAGGAKVARRGGTWWLPSVTRGKQAVFQGCSTALALDASVRTTLAPLMVRARRE